MSTSCVGEIEFVASNSCNSGSPEAFDVAFDITPLGELFNPNSPCGGAPPHNYSEFLCNDSVSTIRTKLLASLKPEFSDKIDFNVLRNNGIGTGFNSQVLAMAVQSDGKIVIGGSFTSYNGTIAKKIIRLNSDFTIDTVALGTGFSGGGGDVRSIVIQPDGKIIVVGTYTSYNGTPSSKIIRLNSDFTIDTVALGTGFDSNAVSAVLQPDGKIIVVGVFSSYNGTTSNFIIRLNSDFTVDTTALGVGLNLQANTLLLQPDGKILVGGNFTAYNGTTSQKLIRLNSDFTIDTVTLGTGFDVFVLSLELQSDGKIIVGGGFTAYNGTTSQKLIRLNSDFTIDTVALGTGFTNNVRPLALQSDGKILVGGEFTAYNGTTSNKIIRLNSDFTIDTVALGTGFNTFGFPSVYSMLIQPDNKIIVGGSFVSYNSIASNQIIRLNSDLSIDTSSQIIYTITVTYTDLSSNPPPTGLFGTILENCVVLLNESDMNLICVITPSDGINIIPAGGDDICGSANTEIAGTSGTCFHLFIAGKNRWGLFVCNS